MLSGPVVSVVVMRWAEVVLLSPACASYDQYDNFARRGEHFKQLVDGLHAALGHERRHPAGVREEQVRSCGRGELLIETVSLLGLVA